MATADLKAEAQAKLHDLAAHWAAKLSLHAGSVIVGLSGGSDSTLLLALAAAIHELEPTIKAKAVHCVHGLDADDPYWLAHCRMLCERLNVPLVVKPLNIVYQNRISPEDSSRKERYRALLTECRKSPKTVLLLGHQKNDQTESFFLALKRGSGPHGLSGMQALITAERGTIARPLLPFSKAEIEAWLNDLGLSFVFDISNTYMKFERNFLRLKVLPLMRERFPALDKAVARTQELCALEHDLAARYVDEVFKRCFDPCQLCLDFKNLDLKDEHLCLMLLRRFTLEKLTLPPELSVLKSALQLMQGSGGRAGLIELNAGYCLMRSGSSLFMVRQESDTHKAQRFTLELCPGQKVFVGEYCYRFFTSSPDNWEEFFAMCREGGTKRGELSDKDVYTDDLLSQCFVLPRGVNSIFLHFGLPQTSTRLHPYGRSGSRELKKLFAEFEVPSWRRSALPVISYKREITAADDIVAVGGVFTCEHYAPIIGQMKRALKAQRLCELWIDRPADLSTVDYTGNRPDYGHSRRNNNKVQHCWFY